MRGKLLDLRQNEAMKEAAKGAREQAEIGLTDYHCVVKWPLLERPAVFIPNMPGVDLSKDALGWPRAQLTDDQVHDTIDFSTREIPSGGLQLRETDDADLDPFLRQIVVVHVSTPDTGAQICFRGS